MTLLGAPLFDPGMTSLSFWPIWLSRATSECLPTAD